MRGHWRHGLTLIEALIVLAILATLIGLLLPAVLKVRAAQARTQSYCNLKQINLGVRNYADTFKKVLPPGIDDQNFSTAAYLLAFIEQNDLFQTIDFKKSIDDEANAAARQAIVRPYLSPRDPIRSVKAEWGATNYLFNDQVFLPSLREMEYPRSISDGTSNTISAGETLKGDGQTTTTDVRRQYVLLKNEDLEGIGADTGVEYFQDGKNIAGDRCSSWMDGRFLQGTFNGRLRINDERPDVSCGGVGGISALRSFDRIVPVGMLDGSVRSINMEMSHDTWKAALTPSAGEILGPDW